MNRLYSALRIVLALLTVGGPPGLLLAGSGPVTLTSYAEAVGKIIKFDRKVLLIMKEESGGEIHRLIGYNENDFQIIADGVFVPVPEERTEIALAAIRKKLLPLKYMAFVVEINDNLGMNKIGVLKGMDQYEIVRTMHTDGKDYDITNDDVVERLQDWEKTSPFDIIGADNDWVEIEFKTLPKDLKAFAEEVYDFCPDAVEQGPGSVAELARDIQQTKKLFLWWD